MTVSSLLPASCQADAHWLTLTRWPSPPDAPGTARRFDLVSGQSVRTKCELAWSFNVGLQFVFKCISLVFNDSDRILGSE